MVFTAEGVLRIQWNATRGTMTRVGGKRSLGILVRGGGESRRARKKRLEATDMATSWPRSMYAQVCFTRWMEPKRIMSWVTLLNGE